MDAPVGHSDAATSVGSVGPREDFLGIVAPLLADDDRAKVGRAYDFAAGAHDGQVRQSGQPYIIHPVAVATILAQLRLDADTLCAALLHDVAEDTPININAIEQEFGAEISALVDGVTRLREAEGRLSEPSTRVVSRDEGAAEGVRKMFLAMAQDIRVVLLRLADRLHNMRTLDHMAPAKRRRIAQETLDIYAPLASRLGIWQIKWELEDLSFRHLDPEAYREIAQLLKERRVQRERDISQAKAQLADQLQRSGIAGEIVGRPKHIYSIWRKMQVRGVEFENIYDLLAVRVIVESKSDCYGTLGIVHELWTPIAGQFDDYIARPKDSMYQSLHTTVMGPSGRPLEVQIRTHEMHKLAEFGIAAHWRYKEGGRRDEKYENKIAWVRQLLEWQSDVVGGAQEFVANLKEDVFRDQVYVFTPRGEVRELPNGATPLDFAYLIHTDIGHRCVGAKVNGRIAPLESTLKSGEIVEILTSKHPKGPSRDWLNPNLNFVRTAHARDKIRQWFHRQRREENLAHGREVLEKELARLGLSKTRHDDLAALLKYERVDDFLVAIGCGDISSQSVAHKLLGEHTESATESTVAQPMPRAAVAPVGLVVGGVSNLLTRVARCCNPVPGDAIIGFTTRGTGTTVHRADCPNIAAESARERLIAVDWGRGKMTYPVRIRIEAWDRDGLLRDVSTIIAEDKINMSDASSKSQPDQTCVIRATLEVTDIGTISRVFSKLEGIRGVSAVIRETS